MTFNNQDLDRIAHLDKGDLSEIPFAVMLYALARSKRTTSLRIQRGPLQKEILFEDGVPVDCRSNLVHETLSRFMVSTGRLDETTAATLFNESVLRSVRFGDVLIEKKIIGAEDLIKILQQNLAHKLLDGFSWLDGNFLFTPMADKVDSPLKVNVPNLILIGVGRFATQEQIDSSTGPLIGTPLALNDAPAFPVEELKLSKAYSSLIEVLQTGPSRIDELAAKIGIQYEELTRLLYALTLIEIVVPADQVSSLNAPPAKAPPQRKAQTLPQGAAEVPTKAPLVSPQIREEIMELALNHRRKSAAELLEVEAGADNEIVGRRFIAFAEKYAPWQFDTQLSEKARDVFLAGVRAYTKLIAAGAVTAGKPTQQKTVPAASEKPTDQFRIKTELLDPVVQFEKGMKLVEGGSYRQAVVQLEFAADVDPQNLLYKTELAYCRYLVDPADARPALEGLRETLRIDPSYGLALYYSGEILRQNGLFDEAESFLKRALKPMAPDRRPVDALRQLTKDRTAAG